MVSNLAAFSQDGDYIEFIKRWSIAVDNKILSKEDLI